MHKTNLAQENTLLIKLAYTCKVLSYRLTKQIETNFKFGLKIINQTDTQGLDLHELFGLKINLIQFLKVIFKFICVFIVNIQCLN